MPARLRLSRFFLPVTLGVIASIVFAVEGRSSVTNSPGVRIPLELRRGTAFVKARVNSSEPLSFKLDTGFGVTTVHPSLAEALGLERVGRLTIKGIAGDEPADWLSGATFELGAAKYAPRRVVRIPSEAGRSRRSHSGILGAGFFRRFVVEFDTTGQTLTMHEPEQFVYTGPGEILPLQFRRDTPTVEADILLPGREPLRARYAIDSGCDGALCFGSAYVKSHRLGEAVANTRAGSRTGVGGSVDTQEAHLPRFQLGGQTLENVEANFFREGSPVDDDLAGHIGMGVLREFKVIFDYARRRVILERTR